MKKTDAMSVNRRAQAERATLHWDHHAIKAEISRLHKSLNNFAKSAGLTPSHVRASLITPYPKVNKAIAAAIGQPVHVLWPDWFDKKGERKTEGRCTAAERDALEERRRERSTAQ